MDEASRTMIADDIKKSEAYRLRRDALFGSEAGKVKRICPNDTKICHESGCIYYEPKKTGLRAFLSRLGWR